MSIALLLATPIFGLSLQLHAAAMTVPSAGELALRATTPIAAYVDAEQGTEDGDDAATDAASTSSEDDYVSQLRTRDSLAGVHRVLGISTWAAMTFTVITGFIQYYNLYGVFADQASNPCVQGDAVFGQGQCSGTPLIHGIGAGVTTLLYASTFTISLLMPDPDNLAEGPGKFASTLRMHKFLRWVHLGGMVLQAILGPIIANSSLFGIDRANNYGTMQALATVHMASGLVTLGALTWAGALMTF